MEQKFNKLEQLIQTEIAEQRLLSAALMIHTDQEPNYCKAFGDYTEQNIYRIYSMTKVITSIAIFKLLEENKLQLADPVSQYFPEFEALQVYNKKNQIHRAKNVLTIQHLLNMTSGLGYPNTNRTACDMGWFEFEQMLEAQLKNGTILSTSDICRMMSSIPCAFEPGTQWKYSASADLLGGIIEQASNTPLDVYLKKILFEPLGMNDTDFYIPEEKIERIAPMYTRNALGKVMLLSCTKQTTPDIEGFTLPDVSKIRTTRPMFLSGGAGLYCSIQDYHKILIMLLNQGTYEGTQILAPDTVALLATDQLSDELEQSMYTAAVAGPNLKGYSYSNLVRIMKNPPQAIQNGCVGSKGEFGWDGLPGNYCLVDPEQHMTAIFMIQIAEGADLNFRAKLRHLLYS